MGRPTLPIFDINTKIGRDINTIMVLQGYIRYFHNEQQLRAVSTGIFNGTINHIKRVSAQKEGVQWAVYSAHDTTIQSILARIGLTSVQCIYQNYLNGTYKDNENEYCIVQYPGYASQIIF